MNSVNRTTAENQVVLVIDTGSSSMRGVLFGNLGTPLFTHQIKYTMTVDGDSATQSPGDFFSALREICSAVIAHCHDQKLELRAISLTSQRSSVLPIDRNGGPLDNFMMWYDKRPIPICNRINLAYGPESARICGSKSFPALSAPKIAWYRENCPEIYRAAYRFLGVQDYLLFLLSERFSTDNTLASRTHLMDLRTGCWSGRMLELYQIDPEKLCDIFQAGSVVGETSSPFCREVGIPLGLPIISAGGDQQCSVLGQLWGTDKQICVTVGSGAYITCYVDNPSQPSFDQMICTAATEQGHWLLESSISACGTLFDWSKKLLYGSECEIRRYEELISEASPGANGLFFCPDILGNAAVKGVPGAAWLGASFASDRKDFARSVLEAMAADIATHIRRTGPFVGENHSILMAGGLARFRLFVELVAEMTGIPVFLGERTDTTAYGAWLQAARTLGLALPGSPTLIRVQPQMERQRFYADWQRKWHKIYKQGERYEV